MKESAYNVWVRRDDASYVFSGVSGCLLRVPQQQYDALQRFLGGDHESSGCPPKLLEQMAVGRMLVPDDGDELALLAMRYQLSRFDTARFGLTMVTSLGCNFDCPYCFEAKHPSIMSDEVMAAVLRVLDDQLPRIKAFDVTWFGGEPLVGKRPLLALSDAFIERCEQNDVTYCAAMTTNGYLLDEQTCAELRDRRVGSVQICLDGPPEIHDKMRPLVNGKGTFWRIVGNLRHAVDYLDINIRMNVDSANFAHAEELLQILAAEGLAGKLTVGLGQIVGVDDGVASPSATYKAPCFTNPQFAQAELQFAALSMNYGFGGARLPSPMATPCTAVRANELVVGSEGELYKCWESVGNRLEQTGTIFDYLEPNGRARKWMIYDPFSDAECSACIALPVCMGGCAHHSMDLLQHENRCSTFRTTYKEQVLQFVDHAERQGAPTGLVPRELARPMDGR